MTHLNNDTLIKQEALKWFNDADESSIQSVLIGIASNHPELDEIFSKKFTISDLRAIGNNDIEGSRVIALLGIITSLIDPFMAQSSIGQEIRHKAKSVLLNSGINYSTDSLRSIDVSESEFSKLFFEVTSKVIR